MKTRVATGFQPDVSHQKLLCASLHTCALSFVSPDILPGLLRLSPPRLQQRQFAPHRRKTRQQKARVERPSVDPSIQHSRASSDAHRCQRGGQLSVTPAQTVHLLLDEPPGCPAPVLIRVRFATNAALIDAQRNRPASLAQFVLRCSGSVIEPPEIESILTQEPESADPSSYTDAQTLECEEDARNT